MVRAQRRDPRVEDHGRSRRHKVAAAVGPQGMLSWVLEAQPVSTNVIIVVDLDATAAPPASDALRQLLTLVEGISAGDSGIDWRLTKVTLNSPLRAELEAFTSDGEDVSDARAADAAHRGLEVLAAVNDNAAEASRALAKLEPASRAKLKGLLSTLKGRTGAIEISMPGRFEYRVTGAAAEIAVDHLARMDRASRPPKPDLGSVEGRITAVTTHYRKPAIKLHRDLTDDSIQCVFASEAVQQLGASHTLGEVWEGQRVEVSGELQFDAEGRVTHVWGATMRSLRRAGDVLNALKEAHVRGEVVEMTEWPENG